MTSTLYDIADINNSSDIVWEALCVYEDGDAKRAWAMVAGCTAIDRILFEEKAHEIDAKFSRRAREAKAAEIVDRIAFRNALRAEADGSHHYEGRCLARAGY